jgi:hypothetical protein
MTVVPNVMTLAVPKEKKRFVLQNVKKNVANFILSQ